MGDARKLYETTVQHKTAGVPAAAEHIKDSNDNLTYEQRGIIAARRQTAFDKRAFREWENEDAVKTEKTSDISQCGPGLATSTAVHAAIGRNFMRSRRPRVSTTSSTTQLCHYGHINTSSKRWLSNPTPSFWVGVPSGAVLGFRCYQRGYRGGLPPEQQVQDAPT